VAATGQGRIRIEPENELYHPGAEVRLTALPDEDWYFAGWREGLAGPVNPATIIVDEYKHVQAVFAQFPHDLQVDASYPNPFVEATTIRYRLQHSESVKVEIFDLNGRTITTLFAGFQRAGTYESIWQGREAGGRSLPRGVYFCRVQAGPLSQTLKIILL
jgi:hypothetical protein